MTQKMHNSSKRTLLFDIIYTFAVSITAVCVYIFGCASGGADPTYLGIFVLGAYIFFMLIGVAIRAQLMQNRTKRGEKTELYNIASLFFGKMHLQLAVVNSAGEIITANDAFREAFLKNEKRVRISIYDLFLFPDVQDEEKSTSHLFFDRDGSFTCEYGTSIYDVTANTLGQSGNSILIFEDRTERRELIRKFENARTAVAYIELDNISELSNGTFESKNRAALAAFDDTIKQWGEYRGILICEHESWKYLAVMTEQQLTSVMDEGFSSLLAPVSEIKTEDGVSLSFSLGTSTVTEGGVEARNTAALTAFEMAVNRGGATVAVKTDNDIVYFGGNIKTQPKRAKNRARYNAKQLEQLIKDADNVLIMGHSSPDYDCIGAQMGIYCMCREFGAEAYIVSNEKAYYNINEAVPMIDRMRQGHAYRDAFIDPDGALDKNNSKTLLICVDVSNTDKMESKTVFSSTPKCVIIDHHRKYAEFDKDIDLEYIDTSASSASELVSEMIELLNFPGGAIMREEATMLLSGIYLDTDNFRKSTGTRTFSAALFLRDVGADIDTVKKLFDISVNELELESKMSENFEMYKNVALIHYDTNGITIDPKTRARVADSFVRAKEVEAAFVLCGEEAGPVSISARSAGTINVELIMKKLGGGGSFDRAGGFVREDMKSVSDKLKIAIAEILKQEP